MDGGDEAAVALTRKRLGQAAGAIRKASRYAAQAASPRGVLAAVEVRTERDLELILDVLSDALRRGQRVEAVVLADPNHNTAPNGGEGDTNGTHGNVQPERQSTGARARADRDR